MVLMIWFFSLFFSISVWLEVYQFFWSSQGTCFLVVLTLLTSLIVFYFIDSYSDVFISFYLVKKKKNSKENVCVCSLLLTFLKESVEIVTLCWLRLHTNPWNFSIVHLKAMFYPMCLSFSRNWSLEGKLQLHMFVQMGKHMQEWSLMNDDIARAFLMVLIQECLCLWFGGCDGNIRVLLKCQCQGYIQNMIRLCCLIMRKDVDTVRRIFACGCWNWSYHAYGLRLQYIQHSEEWGLRQSPQPHGGVLSLWVPQRQLCSITSVWLSAWCGPGK